MATASARRRPGAEAGEPARRRPRRRRAAQGDHRPGSGVARDTRPRSPGHDHRVATPRHPHPQLPVHARCRRRRPRTRAGRRGGGRAGPGSAARPRRRPRPVARPAAAARRRGTAAARRTAAPGRAEAEGADGDDRDQHGEDGGMRGRLDDQPAGGGGQRDAGRPRRAPPRTRAAARIAAAGQLDVGSRAPAERRGRPGRGRRRARRGTGPGAGRSMTRGRRARPARAGARRPRPRRGARAPRACRR